MNFNIFIEGRVSYFLGVIKLWVYNILEGWFFLINVDLFLFRGDLLLVVL